MGLKSVSSLRGDLQKIAALIEPTTRVLDLGCGDGTLLSYLQEQKGACRYHK